MICPDPARIAAAVAGEDGGAAEHALVCSDCRARFDEQRTLRRLASSLSGAPMTAPQRDRLAAAVMARLDAMPVRHSLRRIVAAGLAAAALALVLWALGSHETRNPPAPTPMAADPRALIRASADAPAPSPSTLAPPSGTPAQSLLPPIPEPAPVAPPPAKEPQPPTVTVAVARLSAAGAQFGRATRSGQDVIDLRDGELTVDARQTAPAEIRLGDTAIHVADARVKVTARTGALAAVAVFAGSVEVSSGARSTIVTAGTVWEAPADPPAADLTTSLEAFRAGWLALRGNQFAAAIAAFDRATDPVVQEDALYWAAVAASRAEDRAAARARFGEFLSRFPLSARADAARRALDADSR